MENSLLLVKLPKFNIQERDIIIKALNYYRMSSIEFLDDLDDIVSNVNDVIKVIEKNSNIYFEKQKEQK